MRIGISGVSSTGKSTLASEIAKATGYKLVSDVELHREAFNALNKAGKTPSTTFFPNMSKQEHVDFERAIHSCRLTKEYQFSKQVIFDETPLDFINYYYVVCAAHPEIIPSIELKNMIDKMWEAVSLYDLIIYLPFNVIPVIDDSRRFTNQPMLEHWDLSLNSLIFRMDKVGKVKWVKSLHTSILEERVKEVMKAIAIIKAYNLTPASLTV